MRKVAAGAAGIVGLVVAGVKLAKKITEKKKENRVRDLDDSLKKTENITAEKQKKKKNHRDSDFAEMI